jgi:hypothetical protein
MGKYLPSILPIVALIASAVTPAVQGWESHHPIFVTVAATLTAIINHWVPSPNQAGK